MKKIEITEKESQFPFLSTLKPGDCFQYFGNHKETWMKLFDGIVSVTRNSGRQDYQRFWEDSNVVNEQVIPCDINGVSLFNYDKNTKKFKDLELGEIFFDDGHLYAKAGSCSALRIGLCSFIAYSGDNVVVQANIKEVV